MVTGPTVIIPLLRQSRLKRRPASYLKWEGIINDPLGAILAVLIFQYVTRAGEASLPALLAGQGLGLLVAAGLGLGGGYGLGFVFRHGYVPEYLKGPGTLPVVLAVYVLSDAVLAESGLLAATILGVVLGNLRLPGIDEIRRFQEYVAILLVSAVFLVLTADIDPLILQHLDWRSLALLLAVLVVVRPLSVFGATVGAGMSLSERTLLAWIAPRGIVAASMAGVFGFRMQEQGYAEGALLLPLIFALILLTVILHGLTIGWLAGRLGLSARNRNGILLVGASPWTIGLAKVLQDIEVPVVIADASWHRLRAPRLAGVPIHYGEIVTEEADRSLEFPEVGHLVAATDNDAYNCLACSHFANELGRTNVFQLAPALIGKDNRGGLPRTACGPVLGGPGASFDDLLAKWYHNWTFQKTPITDAFPVAAWLERIPPGALPVLCRQANGSVQLHSPEHPIEPQPGATVIWFGPKRIPRRGDEGSPSPTATGGAGNSR